MKKSLKAISFFTLVCFVSTQFFSPAQGWSAAPAFSPEVQVFSPDAFQIPEDLGRIENTTSNSGPALVHIQTAHGNYEAQQKIRAILHYLKKTYGIQTLFIEGSVSKLEPGRLSFFPDDMPLTMKIADDLTKKAYVKGPELFLLEEKNAEAYGIENAEVYKAGGKAFLEVLTRQEKTSDFVRAVDNQIDRLEGILLNKDLRAFLRRLEEYESNRLPVMDWISWLKTEAVKRLEMNLEDPAWQIDWPMLVRLFKLQEIEKKINLGEYEKEKEKFLKAMGRFIPGDRSFRKSEATEKSLGSEISPPASGRRRNDIMAAVENFLNGPLSQQLSYSQTGEVFEEMVRALPPDFDYNAYPNVKLFIGHLILQSEINAGRLMKETESLADKISDKLARAEEEKKILSLLKNYRLIQKLFRLELTPGEYETILSFRGRTESGREIPEKRDFSLPAGVRNDIKPSLVINQFLSLNSAKRVRDIRFEHLEEIDLLFDKALEYYRFVKDRDHWMIENIEQRMKEKGIQKAVVITGGFHSRPFTDYFTEKGYRYALVSPKFSTLDGREAYVDSALKMGFDLESSTTETMSLMDPAARVPGPAQKDILQIIAHDSPANRRFDPSMLFPARAEVRSAKGIAAAPSMEIAAQKILKVFQAQYGVLGVEDPVTVKVREVALKLASGKKVAGYWKNPPSVYVLRDHREEIGFALPDGSIVLSLPMMGILKTEDELAFLLAHEMVHIQEGHSAEQIKNAQNDAVSVLGYFGLPRLHEYEADLTPVVGILSEAGYHPLAGSTFFESLRDRLEEKKEMEEKKKKRNGLDARFEEIEEKAEKDAWSPAHGGLEDRRLNILSLRYLLDLDGIRKSQKPFEETWKQALKERIEKIPEKSEFLTRKEKLLQWDAREAEKVIARIFDQKDSLGWMLLQEVLPSIYRDTVQEVNKQVQAAKKAKSPEKMAPALDTYQRVKLSTPLPGDLARMHESATRVYSELLDKWTKAQEAKGIHWDDTQKDAWLLAVMAFGIGVDIFGVKGSSPNLLQASYKLDNYGGTPFYLSRKFNDSLMEKPTLDPLLSFLKPEVFREMGIEVLPENVEEQIIQVMKYFASSKIGFLDWDWTQKTKTLDKYFLETDRLMDAVEGLYSEYGFTRFDRDRLFKERLRILVFDTSPRTLAKYLQAKGYSPLKILFTLPKFYTDPMDEEKILKHLKVEADLEKASLKDAVLHLLMYLGHDDFEYDSGATARIDAEVRVRDFLHRFGRLELLKQIEVNLKELLPSEQRKFLVQLSQLVNYETSPEEAKEEFLNFYFLAKQLLEISAGSAMSTGSYIQIAENLLKRSIDWIVSESKDALTSSFSSLDVFEDLVLVVLQGRPDFSARDLSDPAQEWLKRIILKKLQAFIRENKTEEAWKYLKKVWKYFPLDIGILNAYLGENETVLRLISVGKISQNQLKLHFETVTQEIIDALYPQTQGHPEKLLLLSGLFKDFEIQRRVRNYAVSEMLKNQDYPAASGILFGKDSDNSGVLTLRSLQILSQEIAQTPVELRDLEDRLFQFYRKTSGKIGAGVGIDAFLTHAFENNWPFLQAALESRKNGSAFVRMVFREWWERFYSSNFFSRELSPAELPAFKRKGLIDWTTETPSQAIQRAISDYMAQSQAGELVKFTTAGNMLERLYQADAFQRRAILRKILMDISNGVFRDQNKVEKLMLQFIEDHVILDEKRKPEIKKIMEAFAGAAGVDQLYFLLEPVLVDAVLQRPETPVQSREIVAEHLNDVMKNEYFGMEGDLRRSFKKPVLANGIALANRKEAWDTKVVNWAFGMEAKGTNYAERKIFDALPEEYRNPPEFHLLSEIEALKKPSQYLGAPAIRGAQVFGQYVDVDPKIEEEFEDFYDQNEGQSKVVFNRMVRERAPGLLKPGDRITKKLGAGSLVTVYLVEREDGSSFVLKALNPNAEDRVIEIMDLAEKVLDGLLAEEPENKNYQMVRHHLLPDLREWLLGDIRDKRFYDNDQKFRKFNGWTDGSGFSIYIPQSLNEEGIYNDIYLKAEEYIEGTNVNRLQIGDKDDFKNGLVTAENYKKITSMLEKFYWAQVKDSLGLVHSDPHKGNFRLMADGRIAVLDRNFYIELDGRDKQFIRDFSQAGAKDWLLTLWDEDALMRKKFGQLTDYLSGFSESKETLRQKEFQEELFKRWKSDPGYQTKDPVASLKSLIVILKREGVFLPLKMTMLLRGASSLHRLSLKAQARSEVRTVDGEEQPELEPVDRSRIQQELLDAIETDSAAFKQRINVLEYRLSSQGKNPDLLSGWLWEAVLQAPGGLTEERIQKIRKIRESLEEEASKGVLSPDSKFPLNILRNLGIGETAFITPEMTPISQGGGLGMVMKGLPRALADAGIPASVFTFLYNDETKNHRSSEDILKNGIDLDGMLVYPEKLAPMEVFVGGVRDPATGNLAVQAREILLDVYVANWKGVKIYLMHQAEEANKLYPGGPGGSSVQEITQTILLSRGSLNLMKREGIQPGTIVANDWMAAPAFAYLRAHPQYSQDPFFRNTRLGMAIHNQAYQGKKLTNEQTPYGLRDVYPMFDLAGEHYDGLTDPHDKNYLNLLSSGIFHSHYVLTVSPKYAEDIKKPEYGEGLHELILAKKEHVYGISNGIEEDRLRGIYQRLGGREGEFESGPAGEERYFNELSSYKLKARAEVQEKYRLNPDPAAILVSFIGRVAEQKGVRLITSQARKMLEENPEVQLLIGGPVAKGDPDAEAFQAEIEKLSVDFKGRVAGSFTFVKQDPDAFRILLASDIFLMPSRFEPGGLTQLEAQVAGTVVVGREVQGIASTLVDYNADAEHGTAFLFKEYEGPAFYDAFKRALKAIETPEDRANLVLHAAHAKNDWGERISAYREMLQAELAIPGVLRSEVRSITYNPEDTDFARAFLKLNPEVLEDLQVITLIRDAFRNPEIFKGTPRTSIFPGFFTNKPEETKDIQNISKVLQLPDVDMANSAFRLSLVDMSQPEKFTLILRNVLRPDQDSGGLINPEIAQRLRIATTEGDEATLVLEGATLRVRSEARSAEGIAVQEHRLLGRSEARSVESESRSILEISEFLEREFPLIESNLKLRRIDFHDYRFTIGMHSPNDLSIKIGHANPAKGLSPDEAGLISRYSVRLFHPKTGKFMPKSSAFTYPDSAREASAILFLDSKWRAFFKMKELQLVMMREPEILNLLKRIGSFEGRFGQPEKGDYVTMSRKIRADFDAMINSVNQLEKTLLDYRLGRKNRMPLASLREASLGLLYFNDALGWKWKENYQSLREAVLYLYQEIQRYQRVTAGADWLAFRDPFLLLAREMREILPANFAILMTRDLKENTGSIQFKNEITGEIQEPAFSLPYGMFSGMEAENLSRIEVPYRVWVKAVNVGSGHSRMGRGRGRQDFESLLKILLSEGTFKNYPELNNPPVSRTRLEDGSYELFLHPRGRTIRSEARSAEGIAVQEQGLLGRSEARNEFLDKFEKIPLKNLWIARTNLRQIAQEKDGRYSLVLDLKAGGDLLRIGSDGKTEFKSKGKKYSEFDPALALTLSRPQLKKIKEVLGVWLPLIDSKQGGLDRELLVAEVPASDGRLALILPSGQAYWISPDGLLNKKSAGIGSIAMSPVIDTVSTPYWNQSEEVRDYLTPGVKFRAIQELEKIIAEPGSDEQMQELRKKAKEYLSRLKPSNEAIVPSWNDIVDAYLFTYMNRSEARQAPADLAVQARWEPARSEARTAEGNEALRKINTWSAEEFFEQMRAGYASGVLKRISKYEEWAALKTKQEKIQGAGVIVFRKIRGQWKILLGRQTSGDSKDFYVVPSGTINKKTNARFEKAANIAELIRLKIADKNDRKTTEQESIPAGALRELFEETGIRGRIAGRFNDSLVAYKALRMNYFIHIDESGSEVVGKGNGELEDPRWVPLWVVLQSEEGKAGEEVEAYLKDGRLLEGAKQNGFNELKKNLMALAGPQEKAENSRPPGRSEMRTGETSVLYPEITPEEIAEWFSKKIGFGGVAVRNGTLKPLDFDRADFDIANNPWKLEYGAREPWVEKELLPAIQAIKDRKALPEKEQALRVMAKHYLSRGPLPETWADMPVVSEILFPLERAPKLPPEMQGSNSEFTFNLIPGGRAGVYDPVLIKTGKDLEYEAVMDAVFDRAGFKEFVGVVNLLPGNIRGIVYRIIPAKDEATADVSMLEFLDRLLSADGVPAILKTRFGIVPFDLANLARWIEVPVSDFIKEYNRIYTREKETADGLRSGQPLNASDTPLGPDGLRSEARETGERPVPGLVPRRPARSEARSSDEKESVKRTREKIIRLITQSPGLDWARAEQAGELPNLAGSSLGTIPSTGLVGLAPYPKYTYYWLAFREGGSGWKGLILSAGVHQGGYEFTVEFTHPQHASRMRTFRIANRKLPLTPRTREMPIKESLEITAIPALEPLARIITMPPNVQWKTQKEFIQKLEGLYLGKTDPRGRIKIGLPGADYEWEVMGLPQEGWHTFIESAGLKGESVEIKLNFIKRGARSFINTFRFGSVRKAINSAIDPGKTTEVWDFEKQDILNKEDAVQTRRILAQLIQYPPDFNWVEAQLKDELPDLSGRNLGTTVKQGQIDITPRQEFRYAWHSLNQKYNYWDARIERSWIENRAFRFQVVFEKEGEKSFKKTFQLGHFVRLLKRGAGKGDQTLPVLEILDVEEQLGPRALAEIVGKPADFNWVEQFEKLPDIKNIKLGVTNNDGQIEFSASEGYSYRWPVVFKGRGNAGWTVRVKDIGILNGIYELKVAITKEGQVPIEKIFHIGQYPRGLLGQGAARKVPRKALDIDSERGITLIKDFVQKPVDFDWESGKESLARLKGLSLGVTNTLGNIHFSPFSNYSFIWHVLGKNGAGWSVKVIGTDVRSNVPEITLLMEKNGQKVERKFQMGVVTRALKGTRSEEGKTKEVLQISAQLGLHVLRKIISSPQNFRHMAYFKTTPPLKGLRLGVTDKNGIISFRFHENYSVVWRLFGRAQEGWEAVVASANMKNGYYQFQVRFSKNDRIRFRTFQIHPDFMKKLLPSPKTKKDALPQFVLDISPRLGARALMGLITKPNNFDWRKYSADLPDPRGLVVGSTDRNGTILLRLDSDYYFWPVLGRMEKGWKVVIVEGRVEDNHYNLTVKMTRRGEAPVYKTFQIGSYEKSLHNAKTKKQSVHSALLISPRLGRFALKELVSRPPDYDWEKEKASLPDIRGLRLGYTGQRGTISWRIFPQYQDLPIRIGKLQEAGWFATIIDDQIHHGFYRFIVQYEKEGREPIYRIYQIGPALRHLRGLSDQAVKPILAILNLGQAVHLEPESPQNKTQRLWNARIETHDFFSPKDNVDQDVLNRSFFEILEQVRAGLPESEQPVIDMFLEGATAEEIIKENGFPAETVTRIEKILQEKFRDFKEDDSGASAARSEARTKMSEEAKDAAFVEAFEKLDIARVEDVQVLHAFRNSFSAVYASSSRSPRLPDPRIHSELLEEAMQLQQWAYEDLHPKSEEESATSLLAIIDFEKDGNKLLEYLKDLFSKDSSTGKLQNPAYVRFFRRQLVKKGGNLAFDPVKKSLKIKDLKIQLIIESNVDKLMQAELLERNQYVVRLLMHAEDGFAETVLQRLDEKAKQSLIVDLNSLKKKIRDADKVARGLVRSEARSLNVPNRPWFVERALEVMFDKYAISQTAQGIIKDYIEGKNSLDQTLDKAMAVLNLQRDDAVAYFKRSRELFEEAFGKEMQHLHRRAFENENLRDIIDVSRRLANQLERAPKMKEHEWFGDFFKGLSIIASYEWEVSTFHYPEEELIRKIAGINIFARFQDAAIQKTLTESAPEKLPQTERFYSLLSQVLRSEVRSFKTPVHLEVAGTLARFTLGVFLLRAAEQWQRSEFQSAIEKFLGRSIAYAMPETVKADPLAALGKGAHLLSPQFVGQIPQGAGYQILEYDFLRLLMQSPADLKRQLEIYEQVQAGHPEPAAVTFLPEGMSEKDLREALLKVLDQRTAGVPDSARRLELAKQISVKTAGVGESIEKAVALYQEKHGTGAVVGIHPEAIPGIIKFVVLKEDMDRHENLPVISYYMAQILHIVREARNAGSPKAQAEKIKELTAKYLQGVDLGAGDVIMLTRLAELALKALSEKAFASAA